MSSPHANNDPTSLSPKKKANRAQGQMESPNLECADSDIGNSGYNDP